MSTQFTFKCVCLFFSFSLFIIKRKNERNYLKLKYFVITSSNWQFISVLLKMDFEEKANDAYICACARLIVYLHLCQRQYCLVQWQQHSRASQMLKKSLSSLFLCVVFFKQTKARSKAITLMKVNQTSIINCDFSTAFAYQNE